MQKNLRKKRQWFVGSCVEISKLPQIFQQWLIFWGLGRQKYIWKYKNNLQNRRITEEPDISIPNRNP